MAQAVHDRSRCVFRLASFTPFQAGISKTVKWAMNGGFNALEYAHQAAREDGGQWASDQLEVQFNDGAGESGGAGGVKESQGGSGAERGAGMGVRVWGLRRTARGGEGLAVSNSRSWSFAAESVKSDR